MDAKKKKMYKKKVMENRIMKWNLLKQEEEQKTPVMVKIDNVKTTNQRKIADKYGDLLIEKIENLTKGVSENKSIAIKNFKSQS